jgi:hypothetical protein
MCRLSAKQISGCNKVLLAEQQMKIEEVSTLAPLENATELLRSDLEFGVGRDIGFWNVRPSWEQRVAFRVHHQLIVGKIQFDGSRRSERSDIGDGIPSEPERLDRFRTLPGQRAFDQFTCLLFRSRLNNRDLPSSDTRRNAEASERFRP